VAAGILHGTWTLEYGDGFDANFHPPLNVNTFLGFDLGMGHPAVAANHTGKLTITIDGEGALMGAKLETLAGEVVNSTLDTSIPGAPFYGSLTLSGTTVAIEDLPFTPF
jgi:hypothetical protein